MTKKNFTEIIKGASQKALGITTADATVVRYHTYTAICIYWEKTMNRTTVKTMKGTPTDSLIIEEIDKYKKWLNQII